MVHCVGHDGFLPTLLPSAVSLKSFLSLSIVVLSVSPAGCSGGKEGLCDCSEGLSFSPLFSKTASQDLTVLSSSSLFLGGDHHSMLYSGGWERFVVALLFLPSR